MIKFIYSAISKLDMKGKRGIEFNLATIAVAILILIGLILVVVYTLGGFTKLTGAEGIGKAQTEARAGLLGVDWDALTTKEQEKMKEKTPKDAAQIQLNNAQTAIDSKDYDRAIILANEAIKLVQSVASKLSVSDVEALNKRAEEILAKAKNGKKLLDERNKLLEPQKAKLAESEKKIEVFLTRFKELLFREGTIIVLDAGEEKLRDDEDSKAIYKIITDNFNSLLADLDKVDTKIKEEIGYLKLRSNIYLELIKLYYLGKDTRFSSTYAKFNVDDARLKVQTTYAENDYDEDNEGRVLEGVLYYAHTQRYRFLGIRDNSVLEELKQFYNNYGKVESSKFSASIKNKIHDVEVKITDKTDQCNKVEEEGKVGEIKCRALNKDSLGGSFTSQDASRNPFAVCYFDYNGDDDCAVCADIKTCDNYDESSDNWKEQCVADPCGLPTGCKIEKGGWLDEDDCVPN